MSLNKLLTVEELASEARAIGGGGGKLVLTNGCFDILHPGHVRYLREARSLGDALAVALNSDGSVRRLKGPKRPIQPEMERAEILCALEMVDFVAVFHQDTPLEIVRAVRPHVLVKGGDWPVGEIVGAKEVLADGGEALSLPFSEGFSTSSIVRKVLGVNSKL